MSSRFTAGRRRLRLIAILLGIIMLLWLPLEDLGERWVLLLSLAFCVWGAARILVQISDIGRLRARHYILLGAVAGLIVPLLGVALMIFKNGLHGHPRPDFTPAQMGEMLLLIPYWLLGGLLIGAGLGLLHFIRSS